MPKVFVSTVINAPMERVWHTISSFDELPTWMPGLTGSEIEDGKKPDEIGAVRKISMIGTDDILRERLEELDPEEFLIVYSVLEAPLPVDDLRTGMRLRPITDTHGTLAEWFTEFTTKPGEEADGQIHMTRVFNSGFRALKRYLGV